MMEKNNGCIIHKEGLFGKGFVKGNRLKPL